MEGGIVEILIVGCEIVLNLMVVYVGWKIEIYLLYGCYVMNCSIY